MCRFAAILLASRAREETRARDRAPEERHVQAGLARSGLGAQRACAAPPPTEPLPARGLRPDPAAAGATVSEPLFATCSNMAPHDPHYWGWQGGDRYRCRYYYRCLGRPEDAPVDPVAETRDKLVKIAYMRHPQHAIGAEFPEVVLQLQQIAREALALLAPLGEFEYRKNPLAHHFGMPRGAWVYLDDGQEPAGV